MTADIATLQARREALKQALASGHHSVQQGDKRIQFRSVDEIRKALEDVEREIANASGVRRPRLFRAVYRRGL